MPDETGMTPNMGPQQRGEVGRITTHVLDIATGMPAVGLALELRRHEDDGWRTLGRFSTGADGRCGTSLLEGEAMRVGLYEIVFQVADWRGGTPGFYEAIPIRFTVTDTLSHHHVPLILSPFGYSTYRGS
jgi:5-hydroxyisourate hydrolase